MKSYRIYGYVSHLQHLLYFPPIVMMIPFASIPLVTTIVTNKNTKLDHLGGNH